MTKDNVIDVVHKTIYRFFDVVEDDSEEPINEKDKLLLEVNKAICNAIKDMPDEERKTGKWIEYEYGPIIHGYNECPFCKEQWDWGENEVSRFKFCPNCGAEMEEAEEN